MTLSANEFWTSVIGVCVVGLIYFGGETLRDDIKISNTKPWRWGDARRRAPSEATWGTHTALSVATVMLVIFTIGILHRL